MKPIVQKGLFQVPRQKISRRCNGVD